MRLREPFNGLKQAQGHFFFHFALLAGSLMAVTLPDGIIGTTVQMFSNHQNHGLKGLYQLIAQIRLVHLVIGCSQLVVLKLESTHHFILGKVLTCALIILYQGTILYEQFRMSNLDLTLFYDLSEKEALSAYIMVKWMYVEIMGFYFYLISASIFLFWITIKGSCGWSKPEFKKDRFKYDALEYYETDIDWFAFQTVNLLLNATTGYDVFSTYYGWNKDESKFSNKFTLYEVYLMAFLFFTRVMMFIVMPKIRQENQKMIEYSIFYWIPFYLIYFFIFFVIGRSVSDLTFSMIVVDACLFLFQAIYYQFYLALEKRHAAKKEMPHRNDSELVTIIETAEEKITAGQGDAYRRGTTGTLSDKNNMLQSINASFSCQVLDKLEKKGYEKMIKPDLKIQGDIYSLAFAALLDHESQPKEGGFLEDLQLNDKETSDIYMGAMLVVFVQATMMSLIINQMLTPALFEIIAANSFLIIVPRFLSALMMHLNVEPDIRNGVKLMKYAVNNPQAFKGVKQPDGSMRYRNVIAPFILGFFQSTVSIIIEVMVIVFLASLNNLMSIIMKFVSMAAIVKFDDMYAASLFESKVQDAAGKKLKSHFGRKDYEIGHIKKSKLLKFMRFIQKTYRTFYTCYCYYFAPFLAVCITFIITGKKVAQ